MVRDTQERMRDNRLREAAKRQELRLVRSRRRDSRAYDYAKYWLYDADGRLVVGDEKYGATVDEVEAYLKGERP